MSSEITETLDNAKKVINFVERTHAKAVELTDKEYKALIALTTAGAMIAAEIIWYAGKKYLINKKGADIYEIKQSN